MRKALFFALMIPLCMALVGCGGEMDQVEQTEELQLRFQNLSAAQVEADLTCHYGEEVRTYTLRCTYTPEQSRVEVLAPETLAGIAATLTGENLTVEYDGIMLDAGIYSGTDISPMWAVPSILRAMGEGYPLEYGQEELDGVDCLRCTFETTDDAGGKRYYAVWFGEDGIPLRGEIALDEMVVYTAVFTQFTTEETDNGAVIAEDLGGD